MDRPQQGVQRNAYLLNLVVTPTELDNIRSTAIGLYVDCGHVDMAYCWVTAIDRYLSVNLIPEASNNPKKRD